jgi:hypothetical protein
MYRISWRLKSRLRLGLRLGGFYEVLDPTHVQIKLGDSPANLLINQGVMATLQERRLGYHSRAGLKPGTSGFSTLRINHYAARGIYGYIALELGTSVHQMINAE